MSDLREKIRTRWTIEIPDGAAKKKNQQAFAGPPAARPLEEALQIGALEPDHADANRIGQVLAGSDAEQRAEISIGK